MRVAEAVHVDGLDAYTRAAIATSTTANAVASIGFAVAPFIDGKILATHGGRCNWCELRQNMISQRIVAVMSVEKSWLMPINRGMMNFVSWTATQL
jgi:hypothetical protein